MAAKKYSPPLRKTSYPFQDLELRSIKGEQWEDLPGLAGYFMISNLGRIRRLEYETQYKNGAIYTKPEKIIKPAVVRGANRLIKDFTYFLVNRVTLEGIRHNIALARWVHYCFNEDYDIADRNLVIFYRDDDSFNLRSSNLHLATQKEKQQRVVRRGRYQSGFTYMSTQARKRQRQAIAKTLQKQVTQYSLEGERINTFESMAIAQKATGIFATSIGAVASGKKITAGGYAWRFGNDSAIDIRATREARKRQHRKIYGQKVTQYDLKGNRIARYDSLQDAETASGANINHQTGHKRKI
ncbi:MAG TPA: NUMOD4 domain-containing protein [Puia sp.]|nr:NUMOD4 domain-containing protein [Puia sp.]